MNKNLSERLAKEIAEIEASGLYKSRRIIESDQGAEITVGEKGAEFLCK
ncbi:MAG: hypothetical protein LC100_14100 [Chitinophagales bacterium]|nr:hypothetical protein [Chitinophagales bacterium]